MLCHVQYTTRRPAAIGVMGWGRRTCARKKAARTDLPKNTARTTAEFILRSKESAFHEANPLANTMFPPQIPPLARSEKRQSVQRFLSVEPAPYLTTPPLAAVG